MLKDAFTDKIKLFHMRESADCCILYSFLKNPVSFTQELRGRDVKSSIASSVSKSGSIKLFVEQAVQMINATDTIPTQETGEAAMRI